MTVDPDKFGKSRPKLTQEDIQDGDVAILTIAKYEEVELNDPESESGKRQGATLTFQETGDKVLWLNKTQIVALVERLGSDEGKWAGQKVPVEKVTATFGKEKYPKVAVVADPDQWDEYLGADKPAKKKKKVVAKVKGKK